MKSNLDHITVSEDGSNVKFHKFMRVHVDPPLKDGIHVISIRIDSETVGGRSWVGWRKSPNNNAWVSVWRISHSIDNKNPFGRPLKKGDILHVGVNYGRKRYSIMINDDKDTQRYSNFEQWYQSGDCSLMVESISTNGSSCQGNEFTIV